MKSALVIILAVFGLSTGRAQPVHDLKYWTERAAQIHVGMRRADVERILPPYVSPGGGYIATTSFTNSAQCFIYALATGYTAIVYYDFSGVLRDANGNVLQNHTPDNLVSRPVKITPTWGGALREVLLPKLDIAIATNDARLITDARSEIERPPPRVHVEGASRAVRDAKFQLMLAALQRVDAAADKSFDPKDVPMANMAPPQGKDGRLYDSGIAPESIKDPEVRAEYQRMLTANSVKAARYSQRVVLYNARRDWLRVVESFRRDQYDDGADDTNTISRLVSAEIKDAALNKEVTELLAAQK